MHDTDTPRRAAGLLIIVLTATLLVQTAAAKDFVIQNQTGTQIFAANGTTGNVGIGTLKPGTQLEVAGITTLGGDLDLSGNSILNHYDTSPCSGTQAVQDISDDGTFTCVETSDTTQDIWVNESGDTMSGVLTMGSNKIEGLASADSTDDAMPRGDILNEFVDEAGDSMTGNLDMTGGDLQNVDEVGNGTVGLRFQQTGAVQVPNGRLRVESGIEDISQSTVDIFDGVNLNGNALQTGGGNVNVGGGSVSSADSISADATDNAINLSTVGMGGSPINNPGTITGYYGTACSGTQAVQDINDDGTFTCVETTDTAQDVWVNESGDTMSGILNMGGNNVENLGSADSTDDAMPRGDILSQFVESAGDTMTGNLDMQGNDLQNVDRIGNGTNPLSVISTVEMNGNNIATGGGYLSGDGQNEGVYVDNAGQVGVNTNNPAVGLHVNGDFRVTDDLQVMGNVSNPNSQIISVNGSLIPPATFSNTFDLGSSTRQWQDAYLANNLYVDGEVRTDVIQDRGAGTSIRMDSDLDMNGNSITSYFGSTCGSGQAVQDVNNDGTFTCVSTGSGGTAEDVYVNETGDTMSGILNMGSNRIEGVASHDSGDDVMRQDDIDTTYVNEGGDSMTGNLDMGGNNLQNVNQIGNGSRPMAATSSIDLSNNRLTGIGSGNTNFQSDGDLDMNGNSVTSTSGEVCVGDQCA